jgi:hypothetical protein
MKTTTLAPLAALALLLAAAPSRLAAQDDQSKGKIDDVEHSASKTPRQGDGYRDDDEGGGFVFGLLRFFFQSHPRVVVVAGDTVAPPPEPPGQGYLAYPWARPVGDERFVLHRVTTGQDFGNVSGTYFIDDQSSLRSAQLTLEGAYDMADITLAYSFYREPRPEGTDYLHLARIGVAALPPIGDVGWVKLGVGLQGLYLDNGDAAGGPELEAGIQLFPVRPFGLGANARVAPMTWKDGPLFSFGFVDLQANGSLFIGRVELQAGYQWTRVGVGSPFRGPTAGLRVWF